MITDPLFLINIVGSASAGPQISPVHTAGVETTENRAVMKQAVSPFLVRRAPQVAYHSNTKATVRVRSTSAEAVHGAAERGLGAVTVSEADDRGSIWAH